MLNCRWKRNCKDPWVRPSALHFQQLYRNQTLSFAFRGMFGGIYKMEYARLIRERTLQNVQRKERPLSRQGKFATHPRGLARYKSLMRMTTVNHPHLLHLRVQVALSDSLDHRKEDLLFLSFLESSIAPALKVFTVIWRPEEMTPSLLLHGQAWHYLLIYSRRL